MQSTAFLPPLIALAMLAAAQGEPAQSPRADGNEACRAERASPLECRVDFAVVVTPPYGTKILRVWMPVPPSDDTQAVTDSAFETWPMQCEPRLETEPLYGNRFAYFEFPAPKGAQMVRHRFRARTHELRWRVDPARIEAVREWPADFARYLRSEEQSVVIDEEVRALAARLAADGKAEHGPAAGLFAGLQWVDENLHYDHGQCSLAASSRWALEKGCGHCSDYHGLSVALGRALRFPARVTYGINLFPKSSPSHCKAEVFLPPYGWVSFDVSETQKQVQSLAADPSLDDEHRAALRAAAMRRLRSGFRDNTWLLMTRGTDYDLAPKAASGRVPMVRTIVAEADGTRLPEPDPGDASKREFAWMTMHGFEHDKQPVYPFGGIASLRAEPK